MTSKPLPPIVVTLMAKRLSSVERARNASLSPYDGGSSTMANLQNKNEMFHEAFSKFLSITTRTHPPAPAPVSLQPKPNFSLIAKISSKTGCDTPSARSKLLFIVYSRFNCS